MNTTSPITVSRQSTPEERQFALTQIYAQVLERQPYAYERKILAKAEKDFLKDKIGVRRFLKELGHSSVYLDAFYHRFSNLKFIELCFKHFMGRAFADRAEMEFYCNILMKEGVERLITTLLDSEEYRKAFGCFTVPYARSTKFHASPKAYQETHLLQHEHFGQRGFVIPTMYWHDLGLNCDAGACDPRSTAPAAQMPAASAAAANEPSGALEQELLQLLRSMAPSHARDLIATLSSSQREALRQAVRR